MLGTFVPLFIYKFTKSKVLPLQTVSQAATRLFYEGVIFA